jgi:hypothetical protein
VDGPIHVRNLQLYRIDTLDPATAAVQLIVPVQRMSAGTRRVVRLAAQLQLDSDKSATVAFLRRCIIHMVDRNSFGITTTRLICVHRHKV